MRNSSWKGWFSAEVGFSIYIHRRGFTSTTTINHQSVLPTAQGAWAPRAGRAYGPYAYAPWEFAPTRWATPPNRGHKATFAPCETPPGWIGLVLKLDSLYIHRRGFTSSSTINHHLLSRANERAKTHNTERAKLVTRPTKTGLWPTTPRQNLTTHSAGVQRPLVIGGVVVPLYPLAFDQASCQTRLGFSPKGGNRRPDPWNSFRLLQNAISVGSGGGVAGALAVFRQPARPGPLYRWRPGTLPVPALPGAASPHLQTLRQQRPLKKPPPPWAGCLRARSARPRSP